MRASGFGWAVGWGIVACLLWRGVYVTPSGDPAVMEPLAMAAFATSMTVYNLARGLGAK